MAAALQMLTANRLSDGTVLYWRAGGWVARFAEAESLAGAVATEAALAAALDFVARNDVVNPYLFELREGPAGPEPLKERERIRAIGPSVLRTQPKKSESRRQRSEANDYEI